MCVCQSNRGMIVQRVVFQCRVSRPTFQEGVGANHLLDLVLVHSSQCRGLSSFAEQAKPCTFNSRGTGKPFLLLLISGSYLFWNRRNDQTIVRLYITYRRGGIPVRKDCPSLAASNNEELDSKTAGSLSALYPCECWKFFLWMLRNENYGSVFSTCSFVTSLFPIKS